MAETLEYVPSRSAVGTALGPRLSHYSSTCHSNGLHTKQELTVLVFSTGLGRHG